MNNGYKKQMISRAITEVKNRIYTFAQNLNAIAYITDEPVIFENRFVGEEKTIRVGEQWGKHWQCAWFQFKAILPEDIQPEELFLKIDVSGEGLVVDASGNIVQGIVTPLSTFDRSLGDPGKKYIPLSAIKDVKNELEVWVDCGCNDLFGGYIDQGRLREAEIVRRNAVLHKLYFDMEYLSNLSSNITDESYQARMDHDLYESALLLHKADYSDDVAIQVSEKLQSYMRVKHRYEEDFCLSSIGHAHVDLAWLWPIRESKRKAARTFSTAIQMIKKYPDYVFGASQPQMFEWVKDDYPELYEEIKEMVKLGKIECQGGMWVEADTNVSGGEALVRQLLYGKRFFEEEFGKKVDMLWLPDVFGYTGALPQIMKHAAVDYFMTIKLSWSEHNHFPHHTFNWKGIDGSTVLAHMPPEGTYNSAARPESFKKAINQYRNKDVSNEALLVYGIGDGGGGPSEDHLENLERAKKSVCTPIIKQQPATEFFERLVKNQSKYPEWQGELYLERHQGTYTTHAKSKKFNRLMEMTLRECEFACTLASRYGTFDYPKERIERIWKEVLLYQFHDILPGSSIQRVYEESLERYAQMYDETKAMIQDAYEVLMGQIDTQGMDEPMIYFNSLGWERTEWLWKDGNYQCLTVPPMGWMVYDKSVAGSPLDRQEKVSYQTKWTIENNKVKVEFSEDGAISTYYDKEAQRELAYQGKGLNQFVLFEDLGDCWDIPFGYRDGKCEQPKLVEVNGYEVSGKVGIIQTYKVGDSTIQATITLKPNSKMLVFDVEVDWQERKKMLRTQFPVNVHAQNAKCDIQFGHIERPTHRNTSWEQAKIEVAAHKWVDISDNHYGIALINDCKYGYNVWDNVIDMDILRSPEYPSEEEKGIHHLSYALLPHTGDLAASDVIQKAYDFNSPVYKHDLHKGQASELPSQFSLCKIEKDNIIIEAVKQAEDGQGTVIRLYEAKGTQTVSRITFNDSAQVVETNGLEEYIRDMDVVNGAIELSFTPFEIKTLRVL